jgi:hypothetical protein
MASDSKNKKTVNDFVSSLKISSKALSDPTKFKGLKIARETAKGSAKKLLGKKVPKRKKK